MASSDNFLSGWNIRNILYKLRDEEARTLISAIQTQISNILTTISQLTGNKVDRDGDTMTGDLNMSANINMSANKSVNLTGASGNNTTQSAVQAGYNTLLMRSGANASNYHGLRVRGDQATVEYVENVNGTAKNYPIEYSYFTTFSGTSLTAENRHEYAQSSAISSLSIKWPAVSRGMIFGVNFTSASTWNGITHKNSAGSDITSSVKVIGSKTTLADKRYNVICWYDGSAYWMSVKAA